jgi:predicted DNA-binding transcriptional regulator AlpA
MTKRILRLPETEIKVGLRHSEIYHRMKLGTFPKQVRSTSGFEEFRKEVVGGANREEQHNSGG